LQPERYKKTIEKVRNFKAKKLKVFCDTEDKIRDNLVKEKTKLQNRLDVLYEDKLDRKISDEFYDNKFNLYSKKILELDEKISQYTKQDINYYEFGSKILELAKNAFFYIKTLLLTKSKNY